MGLYEICTLHTSMFLQNSFIHFFLHFQSDGNTSFLRAARDGNLQEVLEYLKGSTDINTSNPVSSRPLTLKVQGHIGNNFLKGHFIQCLLNVSAKIVDADAYLLLFHRD